MIASGQRSILWPLLQRPVLLAATVVALLLVVTLALLVAKSWRNVQRLEPLQTHAELLNRLQAAGHQAQFVLIESLTHSITLSPDQLGLLGAEIDQVRTLSGYLVARTSDRLDQAEQALNEPNADPGKALSDSLSQLRAAIETEAAAHNALLEDLRREADAELWLAVIVVVVVTALTVITALFLRWRVAVPLNSLGRLMSELSKQQYRQAPTQGLDPLLIPLFERYNAMSHRLEELEDQQRQYQQRLEKDVRAATTALLTQQQEFGTAQRLAAVGELALSLAHELRNPLASIQAALSNLQNELASDADCERRLALIVAEVKRITRLLNELLSQARQPPENTTPLCLRETVDELLGLLRYQLPDTVRLIIDIPDTLVCRLPPDRFRQALLNLVLNAAQSLGDRPGSVSVSAVLRKQNLTLSVRDDGPGFPAALLDAGVRAFASQRTEGTGLGLAVVRRFATDLGGELVLTNSPGGGTRAVLTLPQKNLQNDGYDD